MSVSESEVHVEIQEAPNHMMASLRECDLSRMPPVPVQLEASPMYHAMSLGGYSSLSTRWAPPTMPEFYGERALAAIPRFKMNGFYMSPDLLERLLQVPEATMLTS